jgi:hypothetical protein
MAATAFWPHEVAEALVPRLQRRLPDFFEASPLDGFVLVERDRMKYDQVRAAVRGALRSVYGPDWRDRVDGFEDD